MSNIANNAEKTMNFIFADVKPTKNNIDKKKRITLLKNNIGKIANIPIEEIYTNENIRQEIDTKSDGFLRLVESVKKFGVLENIVAELRINKNSSDYKLVCIAGHRRILAARAAKNINKIPCLLQSYVKKGDNIGVALAENLNREDLHCIDIAEGYQKLCESGWVEQDLAEHFCRDIRTIRHYLKIASWSAGNKKLLRKYPKIFSTRVILRQFAYKKFTSEKELSKAISYMIEPKKSPELARNNNIENLKNINKKTVKTNLNKYLKSHDYLSSVIKEEIEKAFASLKLI